MGFLAMGCHSPGEKGQSQIASVTIRGQSASRIGEVATAVFQEDGYDAFASGKDLIFQKAGTFGNTVGRDGLAYAMAGGRTLIRVKVKLIDLPDQPHRLECEAFLVSGAGDRFFEEEHRLSTLRKGPYQKLLNKIAQRLGD